MGLLHHERMLYHWAISCSYRWVIVTQWYSAPLMYTFLYTDVYRINPCQWAVTVKVHWLKTKYKPTVRMWEHPVETHVHQSKHHWHNSARIFNNILYPELFRGYFSFQPVLHDWCNKGCGTYYPVCGMMHITKPLAANWRE